MEERSAKAENIPQEELQNESPFASKGPGLAKTKESNTELTNEEILQIISSRRRKIGEVLEGQKGLESPKSKKKPRETWDWETDKSVQTLLYERYKSVNGASRPIHMSVIHEFAHRHTEAIIKKAGIKEEKVIHRIGKEGEAQEFYFRPFAVALRQILLEFMQKKPAEGEMKADGNLLNTKGAGPMVIQRITAYMKEKNMGDVREYLDERGSLYEYCTEEDAEIIKELYEQIKIQAGFRDPKELVALIKGKRKRKNDGSEYTLEDVMKEAEKYKAQDSEWFRPALNKGGNIIESISTELYELLKCHFTGAKKPRAGSMTLVQIQKEYSIPLSIAAIRMAAARAGCVQGKDVTIYEGPDGVTRYYYTVEFTEKLVAEIRKNR